MAECRNTFLIIEWVRKSKKVLITKQDKRYGSMKSHAHTHTHTHIYIYIYLYIYIYFITSFTVI